MFRQSCYVHALIVFHVIVTLQQPIGVPCLIIDNRLKHVVDDCYTRLLIGTKIADGDIALRIDVASLTECEENCSKYRNGCAVFSFGVGVRGNSTCLISTRIPPSENFEVNPDYDVYMKRRENSPRYYFDRPYGAIYRKSANAPKEVKEIREKGTVLNIGVPFSGSVPSSITVSIPRYMGLSSSDGKRFLSAEYGRKSLGINTVKNERTTSTSPPVASCHRKMQAGKKVLEVLIERVVNCENLQDCCRSCDYEGSFDCKGFNHRSGDSKCTCELTSTPYFRMNVDEDFLADPRYDYYEKNQNCLSSVLHGNVGEPNLDNRNRDFGQSGQGAWLDLDGIHEDIPSESSTGALHDYFFNGHAQPNHRSKYEYPFGFTPRHDTLNWNRNWKDTAPYNSIVNQDSISNRQVNHRNEYLNTKYPIVSNGRLGDREWIGELSVPNENGQFHGQFYNYGKAYDYRETYVPITMEPPHEKHENLHRCSFKAVSGTKLSRSIVRKTCYATDFDLCEDFCINETSFSCESFAYRYSASTNNPTDNCLLSNFSYRDLNFYTDLEPDRDSDSYVIATGVESCNLKESKVSDRYQLEECFVRIRSGFTIPMAITKKSLFVNDLGECQLACTASEDFFCKCFVYKYAAAIPRHTHDHVSPNCFLSDWPTEQIHYIDMPGMNGAELYERNTYPYGCDVHPSSTPIPNAITQNGEVLPSTHKDEFCYSKHHGSCKLMSHAIAVSLQVATITECRRRCTMMRYTGTIPCMSFNYIGSTTTTTTTSTTTTTTTTSTPNKATIFDDVQDNCFISDVSIQDLRPNLDYVHNGDHTLYAWTDYDPRCKLMTNTLNAINVIPMLDKGNQPHILANYPNNPAILNDEVSNYASDSDPFARWKSKLRPIYNEDRYLRYSSINENSKPLQNSASHAHDGQNFLYSTSQSSPFQRYTVNGHPCKNGTVCQRNKISGFWSCEIEPEYGSWDYCCQPNHRCGFSKGYHHPWCYVGSNEDQWRPCSETYYPYYFSKDHSIYRQSAFDTGRHWPVIYFHQVSPPNCTTHDDYYKKL